MENIKYLFRKRIINLFEKVSDLPIIYVKGQSGKGKKIAVKQYLEYKKIPYEWYNLSCIMGLKQIKEKFKSINSKSNITIVLDGFKCIHEDILCKIVLDTINLNQGIKFIIISRVVIPLEFKPGHFESKFGVIKPQDLKFTKDEVIELFELNGLRLPIDQIDKIFHDTYAWPIGLAIVLKVMEPNQEYDDRMRDIIITDIYDYFDQKYKELFTSDIKKFLYVTSLLDSFTIDLANYLLNITNSKDVVDEINEYGQFIFNVNGVYTYLDYFKLYFNTKCYSSTTYLGILDIYKKAASFYNNEPIKALNYYLKAQDYYTAIEIIEQEFINNKRLEWYYDIEKYIDQFPQNILLNSVPILTIYIIIHLLQFRIDDFYYWYWKLIELKDELSTYSEKYQEILLSIAFIDLINPDSLCNSKIFKNIKILSKSEKYSKIISNISLTGQLPSILFGLKDNSRYFRHLNLISMLTNPFFNNNCPTNTGGTFDIAFSELLYYQNQLSKALVYGLRGISSTFQNQSSQLFYVSSAINSLILCASNKSSLVFEKLENVKKRIEVTQEYHLLNNLEASFINFKILLGELDEVKYWLKNKAPNITDKLHVLDNYQYYIRAKALVANNEYYNALIVLTKLQQYYSTISWNARSAQCLILSTICHYRLGNVDVAYANLEDSILKIQEFNFIRIFADFGKPINVILNNFKKTYKYSKKVNNEFLNQIINESYNYGLMYPLLFAKPNNLTLTKTELQVLEQLCSGLSNKEISEILCVSLETIKSHLKNIYSKIDVKNRGMAIIKAKQLFKM